MKTLTASDRKSLIRLASELPEGSEERRAILSGLKQSKTAAGPRMEDLRGECVKWAPALFDLYEVSTFRNSLANRPNYTIATGKTLDWVQKWGKQLYKAWDAQNLSAVKSLGVKADSEDFFEDGGSTWAVVPTGQQEPRWVWIGENPVWVPESEY
jgi:hypothetical protein